MPRRPSDADEKEPIREARRRDAGASRRRLPIVASTMPKYGKEEKLAIFQRLFRGRGDVYPARWENARRGTSGYMPDCSNKFIESVCQIRTTKCGQCSNQAFRRLDQRAIEKHLQGYHTIGVYPLLVDGTCWLLALDFDARTWRTDVQAVRDTCTRLELPVYVERSRSGKGAHVWLFFSEPVRAKDARALGHLVLSQAIDARPSLALRSFDRMFPSQDSVTEGGFGNLIALPLQRAPRDLGNSVFVDQNLEPFPGEQQWDVLANVVRIDGQRLASLLKAAPSAETIKKKRAPPATWRTGDLFANVELTQEPPASCEGKPATQQGLPEALDLVVRDRIYVNRESLPDSVQTRIVDLAMFSNPEYFRKKAARASTWNTPRVIRCAEVLKTQIALPRGTESAVAALANELGMQVQRVEQRTRGRAIHVTFRGTLTPLQSAALAALVAHDTGVLVLPTGVGKTVVATALIAQRATSTLVIVNRRPLLDQWRAQLVSFLGLQDADIGQVGATKVRPTGGIDLAMIQALARDSSHIEALSQYGLVIVDECHHAASTSFERVLSRIPARLLLGLTATPKRRDGHHPIVHMQLGPIRFEASPKLAAARRPFTHRYFVRRSELSKSTRLEVLSDLQKRLSEDTRRNSFIVDDTVAALREGRSPLVLCQRREHVAYLAERLKRYSRNLFVLMGGLKAQQRRETFEALRELNDSAQRLVIATGSYVGEGFDDARLDTLLLAAPVAWKGTLAQYAGRLHRAHRDKREVWIFDYCDEAVPVLAKMFEKRRRGYGSLGYIEGDPPTDFEIQTDPSLEGDDDWFDVEQFSTG